MRRFLVLLVVLATSSLQVARNLGKSDVFGRGLALLPDTFGVIDGDGDATTGCRHRTANPSR